MFPSEWAKKPFWVFLMCFLVVIRNVPDCVPHEIFLAPQVSIIFFSNLEAYTERPETMLELSTGFGEYFILAASCCNFLGSLRKWSITCIVFKPVPHKKYMYALSLS